jgi:hypothetical protein
MISVCQSIPRESVPAAAHDRAAFAPGSGRLVLALKLKAGAPAQSGRGTNSGVMPAASQ